VSCRALWRPPRLVLMLVVPRCTKSETECVDPVPGSRRVAGTKRRGSRGSTVAVVLACRPVVDAQSWFAEVVELFVCASAVVVPSNRWPGTASGLHVSYRREDAGVPPSLRGFGWKEEGQSSPQLTPEPLADIIQRPLPYSISFLLFVCWGRECACRLGSVVTWSSRLGPRSRSRRLSQPRKTSWYVPGLLCNVACELRGIQSPAPPPRSPTTSYRSCTTRT
jgi:hypothetical protein